MNSIARRLACMFLSLAPQMARQGFRHKWLPLLENSVERNQREDGDATEVQLNLVVTLLSGAASVLQRRTELLSIRYMDGARRLSQRRSIEEQLTRNDVQGHFSNLYNRAREVDPNISESGYATGCPMQRG